MNLLVKKFGPLATIFVSALLAISCEDPGRIGLIINEDNGVISSHYQDVVLSSSMVQFDIRKTTGTRILQAGQYYRTDFGRLTTKTYTQIGIPTVDAPDEAATYSSFKLSISFTSLNGSVPLNDEVQSIDIFQLAQEIDTTYDYTRLDELATNPTPLGTWDVIPNINDTLRTDSVYVIALDDAVGKDLFDRFKAGDPIYNDNGAFVAYFKGLALVPGGNNIDIFQIDNNDFKLTINYTYFKTFTCIMQSKWNRYRNRFFYRIVRTGFTQPFQQYIST